MSARPRSPGERAGIDPKHLYIGIEVAESFFVRALALVCVMPETNFRRPAREVSAGTVTRQAWRIFSGQVRQTHRAMVVVPGLVLLLGMLFCVGMWNESFDRLWGAYLLKDIRFPHPFGLGTVMWFSVLAVATALLGPPPPNGPPAARTSWDRRRSSPRCWCSRSRQRRAWSAWRPAGCS